MLSGVAMSLVLASCVTVHASSPEESGRVPLNHLLSMSEGRPWAPLPPGITEGTRQGVAKDQARHYIAGVIDSGSGRRWCLAATGIPPHEVERILFSRLDEQMETDPALAGRNAANWVSGELAEEFPCD